MRTDSRLGRAWAVLTPPTVSKYATFEVGNVAAGSLRAGLDREGRRFLLIPITGAPADPPQGYPALDISHELVELEGQVARYLIVRCRESVLWAEFDGLASDMIEAAQGANDAARAALVVLARWRRLLSMASSNKLGLHQRLGLFAELNVLRHLLVGGLARDSSVWTGPEQARHDFVLGENALEVKAVGLTTTAVTIHGLDQLMPPDGGQLRLVIALVLEDPDGESIRSIVDEISALSNEELYFPARLASTGWTRGDAEQPYSIAECFSVDVDAATPRLVTSDLAIGHVRLGVTNVAYKVDLDALRPLAASVGLASVSIGLAR